MTIANQQYVQTMLKRKVVNEQHIAASLQHWVERDELVKFDLSDPVLGASSTWLLSQIQKNDAKNLPACDQMSAFEAASTSALRADVYAAGLVEYSGCSSSCLAQGLMYIKRIQSRVSGAYVTSKNFQRLFLVAVMTASKISDDMRFSNRWWATVGCISVKELNQLEIQFISLLDWNLNVAAADYTDFCRSCLGYEPHQCSAMQVHHMIEENSATNSNAPVCPPSPSTSWTSSESDSAYGSSPSSPLHIVQLQSANSKSQRRRSSCCIDLDFALSAEEINRLCSTALTKNGGDDASVKIDTSASPEQVKTNSDAHTPVVDKAAPRANPAPAPAPQTAAPRRMPGRKFGFPPKDFSNVGPSPMSVSARRAHEASAQA